MMKLLFVFIVVFCSFGVGVLKAQNIVGTTPTNKNVVLEILTGKSCVYCTDAHCKAQILYDHHYGRIVVLNIHTGVHAAGLPNYRTAWGDYVGGLFPVPAYTVGAINRTDFGDGVMHSRFDWETNVNNVLGQFSPVNVGGNATIDLGTRELTVDVEAYYTAASSGTSNKFHAIVTQDNIPGPQNGTSGNPAAVLPNGDYNHKQMVRHNLTPNAGDDINTIAATSLYSNQYTYTFPATINNIAVNLEDVNIALYVSEGNATGAVLSGAEANINLTIPAGAYDVSTNAGVFGTADYCANRNSWTPSFMATNQTANVITSIEAQYTVNDGTPVPITISGLSLAQGESTTISFPSRSVPVGNNYIDYSIVSLNGTQNDLLSHNNQGLRGTIEALTSSPTATTLSQDFENVTFLPVYQNGSYHYSQTLTGAVFENPDHIVYAGFGVFYNSAIYNIYRSSCIRAAYFSHIWDNKSGSIVFDNIDLSNNAAPGLSFDYAHALTSPGLSDGGLEVLVSTDCGSTWSSVWSRSGGALATAPVTAPHQVFWASSYHDWTTAQVDLSAYANEASLSVKFHFSKAGPNGNALYVDNIHLDTYSSTVAVESVDDLKIMPNPVKDVLNIEFSLEHADDLNMFIHNALGQKIMDVANQNYVGLNTLSVNTSNLTPGVYFLNITSSNGTQTERFVVEQ